jgi:hypothetical protein
MSPAAPTCATKAVLRAAIQRGHDRLADALDGLLRDAQHRGNRIRHRTGICDGGPCPSARIPSVNPRST